MHMWYTHKLTDHKRTAPIEAHSFNFHTKVAGHLATHEKNVVMRSSEKVLI